MELLAKKNRLILSLIVKSYKAKGYFVFKKDFIDDIPPKLRPELNQRIGMIMKAGYLRASYCDTGYEQITPTDEGFLYDEIRRTAISHKWLERLYGFIAGILTGLLTAFIIHAAGLE